MSPSRRRMPELGLTVSPGKEKKITFHHLWCHFRPPASSFYGPLLNHRKRSAFSPPIKNKISQQQQSIMASTSPARALLAPPPPHKLLIQMSGAPGSGKSTLAKLLQKSIGGSLVIDHDLIRSAILDSSSDSSSSSGDDLPFDRAAKAAYNAQWALADSALEQGLAVIVDSTCNFQEVVDRGSALAGRHGCVYWYVECYVEDIDLLDRRLRARVPMRSQRAGVSEPPAAAARSAARAGEDSRALFRRWISEPCRPRSNVIVVDAGGSLSLEDGMRDVLEEIFPDE